MEKIGNIEEEHNCLVVSLSGDQSYVKIYNKKGELIRHSMSKGDTEMLHLAYPGEYRVETDGEINTISSKFIEIREDANA